MDCQVIFDALYRIDQARRDEVYRHDRFSGQPFVATVAAATVADIEARFGAGIVAAVRRWSKRNGKGICVVARHSVVAGEVAVRPIGQEQATDEVALHYSVVA